ncbi:hypothetical protein BH23ACT11_BH23ACT11_00550 [soil metagenome]
MPFQARYGSMLETTGYQDEKFVKNLPGRDGAQLNATHRDFFKVREFQAGDHYDFEVPKMLNEVFVGDLSGLLPGEEDTEAPYATLPLSTLSGLTTVTYGTGGELGSLSESRKHGGRVVVLGDYPSVEDLALFWTLRGRRPGWNPFPIWLPYRNVYEDRAEELIESAFRESARRERGGGGQLHITSASLSFEYMEDRFRSMFPEADITTDFADFIDYTADYYVIEQQQPVSFKGGTAYVQKIRPQKMERLDPDHDHVVHEVEIEGVKLPAVESVERAIFGVSGRGNRDITNEGAIRSVDPHKSTYPGKDFLEIRLPDGWGLLEAFFEEYGYGCSPSPKSHGALGQMSLLGGVEGINVVANSKVFETLKTLSIRKGSHKESSQEEKQRPYLADRRVETYNFFSDSERFGNKHAEVILRWLVENRILLRGAEIECRRCRLKLWYVVDSIGERWICDGCREEMPIPIKHNTLSWKYRINELWANGHHQGSVAPLLALYAMHAKWGSSFAREGFGYYPGVEVKKRDGASAPVDHIEIDLMALWGGIPVLVECKVSAEHFNDPNKAEEFAGQLAKQVKLAEHIHARKVIVAAPSRFPEDKSILTRQVPEDATVEIEWWDEETLLDPLYLANDLKTDDAERWHLEWLSQALAASSEG